jgi:hypothetical protein
MKRRFRAIDAFSPHQRQLLPLMHHTTDSATKTSALDTSELGND